MKHSAKLCGNRYWKFVPLLRINPTRVIILTRMRWEGHVAHMRDLRNVYIILVREPEGKRPLVRYRDKWKNNIKVYFQ
jgi:hypothetical protein